MEIFKLFGSIFVDNDKANESIAKTDSLAGKMGKGFGAVGKTIVGATAAIGGAVVAGGTALYGMAMKSADAADRIDKLSVKIGMSKQAFQEWDYVLAQNGMDVEKLQVGVKTLTSKMDAAASGNKTAIESFTQLGLSVVDTTGKLKSQEQMTNEVIMALASMENGTEKAKLATELFGKAGLEMMPMLNGGAEGITQLKDRAHELGLVMSDEAVTAGVVLGDTMDDVKKSFGAIVTKVGNEVMPMIQTLLDWVLQYMPQIQTVIGVVFDVIGNGVTLAINGFMEFGNWIQKFVDFQAVFDAVSVSITALVSCIQQLGVQSQVEGTMMNEIWLSIQSIFQSVFAVITQTIMVFIDMCNVVWTQWGDTIMAVIGGALQFVLDTFNGSLQLISDVLKVFTTLLAGDWDGCWKAIKVLFSNYMENIEKIYQNLWTNIMNILDKYVKAFEIAWDKMWTGVKAIASEIWDEICKWFDEAIMDPIRTIEKKTIQFFNAGKAIFTAVWDGLKTVWSGICTWVEEKITWMTDKLMFWKKSEKEMSSATPGKSNPQRVDGSHANGLDYVPYDGYIAELHKGEKIVTAHENKNSKGAVEVHIYNPLVRGDSDLTKMENMMYDVFDKSNRALGVK